MWKQTAKHQAYSVSRKNPQHSLLMEL